MLVIWPMTAGKESGALGICLSSIGKYLTPEGGPTAEAFKEAAETLTTVFARVPLMVDVKALVDVIVRFGGDLILMPPTPKAAVRDVAEAQGAVLEVRRLENGKLIDEVVL